MPLPDLAVVTAQLLKGTHHHACTTAEEWLQQVHTCTLLLFGRLAGALQHRWHPVTAAPTLTCVLHHPCRDYYTLQFMDPSIDTSPIAPELAVFFDDVLGQSVSQLNFKAIVDGLGAVLFRWAAHRGTGAWLLLCLHAALACCTQRDAGGLGCAQHAA